VSIIDAIKYWQLTASLNNLFSMKLIFVFKDVRNMSLKSVVNSFTDDRSRGFLSLGQKFFFLLNQEFCFAKNCSYNFKVEHPRHVSEIHFMSEMPFQRVTNINLHK